MHASHARITKPVFEMSKEIDNGEKAGSCDGRIEVRSIREGELGKLLHLYKHLHENDLSISQDTVQKVWETVLSSNLIHYFVVEKDGQFISSLFFVIIPNLTRGARAIGLIENVVTHADFRNQGIGRIVMEHAIAFAKKSDCYKVMLLSGAQRKDAHHFYKSLGFSDDNKVGFVLNL